MYIFRLGVSMQKFSKPVKARISLYLVVLVFLLSCGSVTLTPTPTETPGPKDLTPCKNSNDLNIYQPISPDSLSSFIYQNTLLDGSSSLIYDSNKLPNAKLGAYLRLANSVRNWTTAVDFPVQIANSDTRFVRLSLTFISPELIELVLLNQSLGENPISREAFIERVNAKLGYFENRKEIVYLITFTSSYKNPSIADPNAIRVNANFDGITLFDTNGKSISKIYSDPPLELVGSISQGHLSGYLAYPMFVYRNKNCTETLNREYATSMILKAEKLLINGNEIAPVTLSLRYHPLLDLNNSQLPDPIPILDNSLLIREPKLKTTPPDPVNGAMTENALYWQNMASYIWWYLASR